MSRFPPVPEKDLFGAQKRVRHNVEEMFASIPIELEWEDDTGLILGPYSPLFFTEDLSDPWFALARAVMHQRRFTIREKELCIIAVLSQYHTPYVHYAHSKIAVRVGFSKEQLQQALHGELPQDLEPRESAIYNLALYLARLHGPMDSEKFEEARKVLGRDEIAAVAHIVSGYIYVSILTNIGDGKVPSAKKEMSVVVESLPQPACD